MRVTENSKSIKLYKRPSKQANKHHKENNCIYNILIQPYSNRQIDKTNHHFPFHLPGCFTFNWNKLQFEINEEKTSKWK